MPKNLILFKRIDFWVQILLNLIGIYYFITFLFQNNEGDFSDYNSIIMVLVIYFWTGIYQISSFIFHFLFKKYAPQKANFNFRKLYFILVCGFFFFGILIIILDLLNYLEFKFYRDFFLISPILALFYLWINWQELQVLEKNSLKN